MASEMAMDVISEDVDAIIGIDEDAFSAGLAKLTEFSSVLANALATL